MRKILCSFILFLTTSAHAVPLQMTQQGRLLDPSGAAVTGLHDLTFRIYDEPTGGILLWEEVITEDFVNGYYASVLGSDTVNNPLDSSVLSMYPLYLELELDVNGPMSPRQVINSAPYAQMAGVSESVDGGYVNASEIMVNGTTVVDGNGEWVGQISVDWTSQISNIPNDLLDGDDDTRLGESEVEGYITNDPIDLASGSSMNGSTLLTTSDTLTPDWSDVQNRPNGLDDGDDVLSESQVENYVTNSSIDLASGSTMNGKAIVSDPGGCTDGQIMVFNFSTQAWACGDDTDTTLSSTEMQAMIETMTLNLQNHPSVNGSQVLTEDSSLNPTNLDPTGSTAGQILISDGNGVNWGDLTSSGCTVVESIIGSPVRLRLQCGSSTFIVEGSTLSAVSLGDEGPWTDGFHCALDTSSEIKCWGQDNHNQVSDAPSGAFTNLLVGGNYGCALNGSSEVECWGYTGVANNVPSGTFASLIGGHEFACGIKTSGEVECWGYTQVSNSTPSGTFTQLVAGQYHVCGLDNSGEVQCWGLNSDSQVSPVPSGPFASLEAGMLNTCGITSSGSVECWGWDGYSMVSGAPSGTFTSLAMGYIHICGIKTAGDVECWGDSGLVNQTPSGTFTALSGGVYHACGITTGGGVKCWGDSNRTNGTPSNGTFVDIESIEGSSCGVLDSGNVICWGISSNGQLNPP